MPTTNPHAERGLPSPRCRKETKASPLPFPFSHRREEEEIDTLGAQHEPLALESCQSSGREKFKRNTSVRGRRRKRGRERRKESR